MTPDTKRAAVERLAKEVMGWRQGKKPYENWWYIDGDPDDEEIFRKMDAWNPFSNLSDAFMVAEKVGGLLLEHSRPDRRGASYDGTDMFKCRIDLCRFGKTPSEAISNAALAWIDARRKEP